MAYRARGFLPHPRHRLGWSGSVLGEAGKQDAIENLQSQSRSPVFTEGFSTEFEVELEETMLTTKNDPLCRRNRRLARQKWGLERNHPLLAALKSLTEDLALSVSAGDVILLRGNWYVTHAGLLRIAKRNRCSGMKVQFIRELSNPPARRFAFEATAFKSKTCTPKLRHSPSEVMKTRASRHLSSRCWCQPM